MLQVSIFQTLQNNLAKIDFSRLLVGVMSITPIRQLPAWLPDQWKQKQTEPFTTT